MSLASRILGTIRKHEMFPRGGRVLVALSGGPDSVALLHLLRVLEERRELTVVGAAHFNHQLRGADADADEQFCRELTASLGVPFEAGRADVARRAQETGRSIEDAARTARYAFLHEAAGRLGADAIAIGHSLDDQAETFLLRLIRGAGPRGLAGIRPKAGRVVRPALELSRAELRSYVAQQGLQFREDATNADTGIPRNRIRHELIPHLQQYSPAVVGTLARAAAVARHDEEYLEGQAIEAARSIVLHQEDGTSVDAEALAGLPVALASRVARIALAASTPDRFIGFQHIDDLLDLSRASDGAMASLPGQVAVRRGRWIVLARAPFSNEAAIQPPFSNEAVIEPPFSNEAAIQPPFSNEAAIEPPFSNEAAIEPPFSNEAAIEPPFSNLWRFPLSIPGEVSVAGWAVSAEPIESAAEMPPGRGRLAVIAAEPVRGPLAVRTRRPGDRFSPLGMGGRGRKLQDFLVDRKVPRRDRDRLPLVVDSDDRIVWVVGQSVAEDFRVTAPQQGVILLKARRLGGVG